MNKRVFARRFSCWCAVAAIGLATGAAPAATTYTWSGLSTTSDNWSDPDNWVGGIAPANDGSADIHFAGSTRTTPIVDTPWTVNSISFDSGAAVFDITGSAVTLATSTGNAMTNSSSSAQTLETDVNFTGGFRAIAASSGKMDFTGVWTIAGGSTIFVRGGQSVTFDGKVTGAGTLNRTDSGSTIINDNTNDFTGSLGAAHGVVVVGTIADAGVASAIGAGSTIALGQGTYGPSDSGTLRYTGATASTNRTVYMTSNGTGGGALGFSGRPTIDVTNVGTTLTFNGNFNYSGASTLGQWRLMGAGDGVINGAINTTGARIQKSGAGTWTLNGAANNTGITEVLAGKLVVNNTLASTDVSVSSGATLGGVGSLAGNLDVAAGGYLAPGSSIGTMNVGGDATLSGTYNVELDGSGAGSSDLLNVTGTLSIGSATVDFSQINPVDDAAYIFATYGSLSGGHFASVLNIPHLYEIRYNYLGGNQIALIAVPEPASLAMLVIGSAAMIGRRSRRRTGR